MKKTGKFLVLGVALSVLCSCRGSQFDEVFSAAPATILTPKAASSVIVCRTHQCAPARTNMTREFLYNSLLNLFDNNLNSPVLFCDADPGSRVCFENYVKFNLKVGAVPATALTDSAKIVDVRMKKEQQTIEVTLDYNMYYNGVRPTCRASRNILFVKSPDYVLMEDTGYRCKFTTVGTSLVSTVFSIDYVDLDYGIIGANYSFGVSGPAFGGGTGYMLMRFEKNAYPSDPKIFPIPEIYPTSPTVDAPRGPVTPYTYEDPPKTSAIVEEPPAEKPAPQPKPDVAPGQYKVAPLPLR